MGTYTSLVESFEPSVEALRALRTDGERAAAREQLTEQALGLLLEIPPQNFEELMVWQTDKLYRIVNHVPLLDSASFVLLVALGAAFEAVSKHYGLRIAYLVDNGVPEDRLRGIDAAFRALGFVVASPELVQGDVALAAQSFSSAIEGRRNCLWMSGACDIATLRRLAQQLEQTPYLGVFRNDAPLDGTQVQIFRRGGHSAEIEP